MRRTNVEIEIEPDVENYHPESKIADDRLVGPRVLISEKLLEQGRPTRNRVAPVKKKTKKRVVNKPGPYISDDELIGQKFGLLKVVKRAAWRDNRHRAFLFKCECGEEKVLLLHNVRKKTKSCGCVRRERAREVLVNSCKKPDGNPK